MARVNTHRLYPRTENCEIKDMVFDPTAATSRGLSKALARQPRKYRKRSKDFVYTPKPKTSKFTLKVVKGVTHKQECESKSSPECLELFITIDETVCPKCRNCV